MENNRSNVVIQHKFWGIALLSLTLLSGCTFLNEPIYDRHGRVIDTEKYARATYAIEEQPVEEAETTVAESVAVAEETEVIVADIIAEPAPTPTESAPDDTAGNYSIQLFGAYDKGFSEEYIQQHQLKSTASIQEMKHQGQSWFVVLYGKYLTYDEASKAREELNISLTTHRPWIRTLSHDQPALLPKYSLQLMASRSRDAAEKLIKRLGIESQGYVYETIRNGAPWYLVFYGEYRYTRDARKAIPTLPEKIQKLGPWVRTMAEIKEQ